MGMKHKNKPHVGLTSQQEGCRIKSGWASLKDVNSVLQMDQLAREHCSAKQGKSEASIVRYLYDVSWK